MIEFLNRKIPESYKSRMIVEDSDCLNLELKKS